MKNVFANHKLRSVILIFSIGSLGAYAFFHFSDHTNESAVGVETEIGNLFSGDEGLGDSGKVVSVTKVTPGTVSDVNEKVSDQAGYPALAATLTDTGKMEPSKVTPRGASTSDLKATRFPLKKITRGRKVTGGTGSKENRNFPTETTLSRRALAGDLLENQITSSSPRTEEANSTDPELPMGYRIGYGTTLMNYSQSGVFGGIKGMSMALNTLSVRAELSFQDWRGIAELRRYSLAFGTDSTNPSTKMTKTFQDFSLQGGYRNFRIGIRGDTAPIMKTSGTNTVAWADLTTLSVLAGYSVERELTGPARRPARLSLNIDGALPFSASSEAGGPQVSNLSGYALRLRGRAEKNLFKPSVSEAKEGGSPQFLLGIEGAAAYSYIRYNGSWSGTSGEVTRNIQEYQGLMTLGLTW